MGVVKHGKHPTDFKLKRSCSTKVIYFFASDVKEDDAGRNGERLRWLQHYKVLRRPHDHTGPLK